MHRTAKTKQAVALRSRWGAAFGLVLALASAGICSADSPERHRSPHAPYTLKKEITADHSQFDQLKKRFASGDEVTRACVSCHNKASEQVKNTPHWLWHLHDNSALGKGGRIVNNYCISSKKLGDKSCLDCHVGWNGKAGEVNCLVCHSQKEMNWQEAFLDLKELESDGDESSREIVQELLANLQQSITAIGQPTNKNCGSCHFYGGGDDGVKRGDLSSSLFDPARELDVHLSKEGAGLNCRDCHATRNHHVPGRHYAVSAEAERKRAGEPEFRSFLRCESCHSAIPHRDRVVNDHLDVIACQTCHIPRLARQDPTKVWWDWSKAGKLQDGKPFFTKDEFGKKNYMSAKGEFRWEKDIVPFYAWHNGAMKNHLLDEPIAPGSLIELQRPTAFARETGAKIYPFKVHYGLQPYDTKLSRLLAPQLSGGDGYWETFDWQRSLTAGMKLMELPYSGEYGFIKTSFMFPAHHTIAPKEMSLRCDDCHQRGSGSRMAGVEGIYVAGRGDLQGMTRFAWLGMMFIALGAFSHAVFRIYVKLRKKE